MLTLRTYEQMQADICNMVKYVESLSAHAALREVLSDYKKQLGVFERCVTVRSLVKNYEKFLFIGMYYRVLFDKFKQDFKNQTEFSEYLETPTTDKYKFAVDCHSFYYSLLVLNNKYYDMPLTFNRVLHIAGYLKDMDTINELSILTKADPAVYNKIKITQVP